MAVKGLFVKGGLIIASSNILQQALLLARNILVALLLPPEQFGIALTLITIITAIDAFSDFGIEWFVVRSPKIADDNFLGAMHLMLIARGMISGLAIFFLADVFAWIFSTPDAVWAYRTLAVVPMLKGFLHLDLRRSERQQNYAPNAIANLAGTVAATLIAVSLAYLRNDYSAMLFAYIAQTSVIVVLSHVFAKAKYSAKFSRAEIAGLLPYSAPLMLNAILLFSVGQGDRLVIGSQLGLKELASYGIISIFTTGVTDLASRLGLSLYMPILANKEPGTADHDRRFIICGSISALMSSASLIFFGILAYPLAQLAFGRTYDFSVLFISCLGTQSAFRILRAWPQIGHLSKGNTKQLLYATLVSCTGIASAVIAVKSGYSVGAVAACMALGEVTAATYALGGARIGNPTAKKQALLLLSGMMLLAASIIGLQYLQVWPTSLLVLMPIALGCAALSYACISLVCKEFNAAVWDFAQGYLTKLKSR